MMDFFLVQIKKKERIVRYIISGGTATGANLALLYVLTDWLGLWYLISAVLAFIGGFLPVSFCTSYGLFKITAASKPNVK